MLRKPFQNIVDVKISRSNAKPQINQLFLRVIRLNTVYFKENKHNMNPCAFISINKRMIGNN